MAEQRKPFRFRLPWLSGPRTTTAQPQRPHPVSETSRAPSQPSTTVPIQRPPFRPARIAPTQPPLPQSQPPAKAEPQSLPPASSSAVTESTKPSPPAAAAKPPSPSLATTESPKTTSQSTPSSAATTKPPSPSSAANNARKDTSQLTSSPSSATTKPQPPPHAATESPKAKSPTASSPSATTAKQESPPPATTESQKDSMRPPSSSTATSESPSPSRLTVEYQVDTQAVSPTATSRLASSPSSETAKPPSPSHAAAESQVKTKAVSPSQARNQSRATSLALSPSKGDSTSKASSLPPSPPWVAPQAQIELGKSSQPQSPPHLASQKTASEVSSPSRKAIQQEPEPTTAIVTPSSPSPDKPQAIIQDSSSASLASTQTQKYASQEEPKKSMPQTPPQESEPKVEITHGTKEKPNSQDDAMARDQIKVSTTEEGVISREAKDKPVSSIVIDHKPLSEAEKESKEPEEREEAVQEIPKEEKTSKATNEEEPVPKPFIEAPLTIRDTKETPKIAQKAPRRQQKQETPERKETIATASYIGKQIKTGVPSQPTEGKEHFSLPEEAPRQREIKEDISNLIRTLTTRPQLDEKPVTVITLTGDNRGASMNLSSEATKKDGPIHIHRGYKTDPDESPETTTDGDVRSNGKRSKDQMLPAPTAYANSNVQSVNNSIVFEASVAERNPGIHLALTQNTAEAIKPDDKLGPVQTHKVEFITTPSEKLTHQPVVRRRCLRGLFMEPSDSDPDNPDKPRRHGCRYSCGEKSKDKEIM